MTPPPAQPAVIVPQTAPPASADQVDLKQLADLAKPFFDAWLAEQHSQAALQHQVQMKELDLEAEEVRASSKQNGWIVLGVLGLSAGILAIAGYLFAHDRSSDALTVIQLTVAVGGAMFGGYGWARGRRPKTVVEARESE